MQNSVAFRGQRFYMENLWESTEGFIWDWGRFTAGASSIEFNQGVIHITS
ncbi:hypothetical protein QJS04_geneDACA008627 [Acorus gramineus]|uniref:Uncharacterized protein n=1 Tax=Acorus gramineus TaxID=55184 RepID=A0AAV9AJ27_ACOGR|nr:hypothetical protein QJS04_geneDACA008627 [Acorus gramineus]